jgi:hypothetical protein
MKRILPAVLSALVFAAAAFSPRAEAYPGTQTECILNLCIVYTWVRTEDANGNFTGWAKVEVGRYWVTGDDWIPAD